MKMTTLKYVFTDQKQFNFDFVANESLDQSTLFNKIAKPIADSCLQGYNGSIFAYGQTGAGKTYTIQGSNIDEEVLGQNQPDSGSNIQRSLTGYSGTSIGQGVKNTENNQYKRQVSDTSISNVSNKSQEQNNGGIIQRSFDYIFQDIKAQQKLVKDNQDGSELSFLIKCSYLEIYNEQIMDLLEPNSSSLNVREDIKKGVYVEGLREEVVQSYKDMISLIIKGAKNRHVGETSMNRESSRSHSVLTTYIESKSLSKTGVWNIRCSRFHIIDLAGSERSKNTNAVGDRLKEAGMINKSLSALGNVINSLVDASEGKQRHIPYRDSKLTFMLRDSLGGNSKTVIIANISPSQINLGETLSTLEFAKRAKQIKNRAVVNEDSSGTILILKNEIKRLKHDMNEQQRHYQVLLAEKQVPLNLTETCKVCKMNYLLEQIEKPDANDSLLTDEILPENALTPKKMTKECLELEEQPTTTSSQDQKSKYRQKFTQLADRIKQAERLLSKNLEILSLQQKGYDTEIDDYENQVSQQLQTISNLSQQINRDKMKLKLRENKIQKLEQEHKISYEEELIQLQQEIEILKEQLEIEREENLNPTISVLKSTINEYKQKQTNEEKKLFFQQQSQLIDELKGYVQTQSMENIENQLLKYEQDLADAGQREENLISQAQDLKQQYEILLQENTNLTFKLADEQKKSQEDREEMNNQIGQFQATIQLLEQQIIEQKEQTHQNLQISQNLQDEINQLKITHENELNKINQDNEEQQSLQNKEFIILSEKILDLQKYNEKISNEQANIQIQKQEIIQMLEQGVEQLKLDSSISPEKFQPIIIGGDLQNDFDFKNVFDQYEIINQIIQEKFEQKICELQNSILEKQESIEEFKSISQNEKETFEKLKSKYNQEQIEQKQIQENLNEKILILQKELLLSTQNFQNLQSKFENEQEIQKYLKQQIEQKENENKHSQENANTQIENLQSILISEQTASKEQLQNLNIQIEQQKIEIEKNQQEINQKEREWNDKAAQLRDEFEQFQQEYILMKQEKEKMEIQMNQVIEGQSESVQQKDQQIQSIQEILKDIEQQLNISQTNLELVKQKEITQNVLLEEYQNQLQEYQDCNQNLINSINSLKQQYDELIHQKQQEVEKEIANQQKGEQSLQKCQSELKEYMNINEQYKIQLSVLSQQFDELNNQEEETRSELESRINLKQEQINQLQSNLDQIEIQLQQEKAERDSTNQNLLIVQGIKEKMNNEFQSMIESYKIQIQELQHNSQSTVSSKESDIFNLSQQIRSLKEQQENKTHENIETIEQLKNHIKILEEDVKQIQEQSQKEISEIQNQTQNEIFKYKKELKEQNTKFENNLNQQSSLFQQQSTQQQQQIDKFYQEIQSKNQQILSLQNFKEQIIGQNQILGHQNKQFVGCIKSILKIDLEDSNEHLIDQLEDFINQNYSEYEQLKGELAQINELLVKEKQINIQQTQTLNKSLEEFKQQNMQLQQKSLELLEQAERNSNLEIEYAQLQSQLTVIQEQIQLDQDMLQAKEDQISKSENKLKLLEQEKDNLQFKRDEQTKQLEVKIKELKSQMKTEVDIQLQEALQFKEQAELQQQQEINEYKKQIESLKIDIERIKKESEIQLLSVSNEKETLLNVATEAQTKQANLLKEISNMQSFIDQSQQHISQQSLQVQQVESTVQKLINIINNWVNVLKESQVEFVLKDSELQNEEFFKNKKTQIKSNIQAALERIAAGEDDNEDSMILELSLLIGQVICEFSQLYESQISLEKKQAQIQIYNYKRKCESLQAEIFQKKEQLNDISSKKETNQEILQSKISLLEKEKQALFNERQKYKDSQTEQQKQLFQCIKKLEESDKAVKHAEKLRIDLEQIFEVRVQSQEQEIEQHQLRYKELEYRSQQEARKLEKQTEELIQQLQISNQNLATAKQENNFLNQQINDFRPLLEKAELLEQHLQESTRQKQQLNKLAEGRRLESEDLQAALAEAISDLKIKNKLIQDLEKEIDLFQSGHNNHQQKIHLHMKIKEENNMLRDQNIRLQDDNFKRGQMLHQVQEKKTIIENNVNFLSNHLFSKQEIIKVLSQKDFQIKVQENALTTIKMIIDVFNLLETIFYEFSKKANDFDRSSIVSQGIPPKPKIQKSLYVQQSNQKPRPISGTSAWGQGVLSASKSGLFSSRENSSIKQNARLLSKGTSKQTNQSSEKFGQSILSRDLSQNQIQSSNTTIIQPLNRNLRNESDFKTVDPTLSFVTQQNVQSSKQLVKEQINQMVMKQNELVTTNFQNIDVTSRNSSQYNNSSQKGLPPNVQSVNGVTLNSYSSLYKAKSGNIVPDFRQTRQDFSQGRPDSGQVSQRNISEDRGSLNHQDISKGDNTNYVQMASKHKQYKQAQSQRKTILGGVGTGQKRKDMYGDFDEAVNQAAYVDDTLEQDGYNYA